MFASGKDVDLVGDGLLVQVLYLPFLPEDRLPVFADCLDLFDALQVALLQRLLPPLIISPYKRVHLNTIINFVSQTNEYSSLAGS